MGFSFDISVPVLTVFLQGLVSFFSPCVLPLLPLYIGYLSGGTGKRGEDGRIHYERKKVMIHTLCFVIGVSFAFFLLGFGFSAMGNFFKSNQLMFARVGGILVVLFGLYQLHQLLSTGYLLQSYWHRNLSKSSLLNLFELPDESLYPVCIPQFSPSTLHTL